MSEDRKDSAIAVYAISSSLIAFYYPSIAFVAILAADIVHSKLRQALLANFLTISLISGICHLKSLNRDFPSFV